MDRSLRERVIDLLQKSELSVSEICKELELEPGKEREIYSVIQSLPRILKKKGLKIVMLPPKCLKCGFEFQSIKASRCPRCKGERISEARFKIV